MGPCLTGANEKYIGDALLQKTYTTDCISKTVKKNQGERPMVYVENNHPPIIPKEIFYQVREEMARRAWALSNTSRLTIAGWVPST